jgi:hypothetical protein
MIFFSDGDGDFHPKFQLLDADLPVDFVLADGDDAQEVDFRLGDGDLFFDAG